MMSSLPYTAVAIEGTSFINEDTTTEVNDSH